MSDTDEIILKCYPIDAFRELGLIGPGCAIEHRLSLSPSLVCVPPLRVGRIFLERWPVRELPTPGTWLKPHYRSIAPPLFLMQCALVHSSAGILSVEGHVIGESLAHTTPASYGYRKMARAISLTSRQPRKLAGTWINLLTGGATNYFHALVLGLARLSCVPRDYLSTAAGILIPQGAPALSEALRLLNLPSSLEVIEVGQTETLVTEALIYPMSVAGESAYHPCLIDFFHTISDNVPSEPAKDMCLASPYIYIDRRSSPFRPIVNERQLAAGLAQMGFTSVRSEALSFVEQVRLFRQAEIIVAPHGAGLTNIGFARPGTLIIEVLMDAYVNWCFRSLSALMQLPYDCLIGRTLQPWPELGGKLHATPWEVPVSHVISAVAQLLAESASPPLSRKQGRAQLRADELTS